MIKDLDKISDGKIYRVNDMVRAGCQDCAGCHACCQGMGDSIVLDPLDVFRLHQGCGMDFEALTEKAVALRMAEGLILPVLAMSGEKETCSFLDSDGRCSIHAWRPGLCRLFPLGRIYEEKEIRYFFQKDACLKSGRSKVKVGRWLDTPEPGKYESFLIKWHDFRKELGERLAQRKDESGEKTVHLFVLNRFYLTLCEADGDFYGLFEERLNEARQTLLGT